MTSLDSKAEDNLTCSFCGKKNSEVIKLIASAESRICNECVFLSVDILWEEEGLFPKKGEPFRSIAAEVGKTYRNKDTKSFEEILERNNIMQNGDMIPSVYMSHKRNGFRYILPLEDFHKIFEEVQEC